MSEQLGIYARIEAVDGAGKTLQVKMLQQFSEEKGIDAVFVREPGGTPVGEALRSIILGHGEEDLTPEAEVLMFTAARQLLYDKVITPALTQDKLVVSDRGLESTVNYQTASGKMTRETVMELSRLVLPERCIRPDILAVLAISKETQRRRLGDRFKYEAADGMESRGDVFLDRVFDEYQTTAQLDYATVIDGNGSPEEVHEQLAPVIFGEYMRRHSGIYLPTNTRYSERNTAS